MSKRKFFWIVDQFNTSDILPKIMIHVRTETVVGTYSTNRCVNIQSAILKQYMACNMKPSQSYRSLKTSSATWLPTLSVKSNTVVNQLQSIFMLRYEICLDYPVLENHVFDNMAPVINIFCNLLPYKSKPLVQKLVTCIVCYFERFTVKVLCCISDKNISAIPKQGMEGADSSIT